MLSRSATTLMSESSGEPFRFVGVDGDVASARAIIRSMARARLAVLLSSVAFAAVASASTSIALSQTPAPAGVAVQDPFPEATGKAALLNACSNCHTPETVIQTLRTRQEWTDVLDQMVRYGADASDQEFDQILTYLVKYFSPIRVNKATAKDLEAAMDIPAAVAEAIVAYRAENGEFKTLDDLKKVGGVDGAQVDALKARVSF
jgi:competence protein ComEA